MFVGLVFKTDLVNKSVKFTHLVTVELNSVDLVIDLVVVEFVP